jgi:ubiquinone/menaquinone biosynthesis C-methylase UbiE
MSEKESVEVEKTLQKPDIHEAWEDDYRTRENNRYYDMAMSHVADILAASEGALLLDAGCGICDYSIRLARRGFDVVAVDFSESVLKNAELNLSRSGVGDKIKLRKESLLSLSFEDGSFDYAICWGVLMHIPEVEQAISELCRVVRKGGRIIISEANMHSLQSVAMRTAKRLLGRQKEEVVSTPAGLEFWWTDGSDRLLTREADPQWLKETFSRHGCRVLRLMPGQFTELYTRASARPVHNFLHRINRVWFRHEMSPRLAFGNIFVFEKTG